MKRRRFLMYVAIILMAVGFAAVSTTLYINGQIKVVANVGDFDVYFSKAIENGKENNSLIVDKTHIAFKGELSNVEETYDLRYTVTNGSKNYDSNVTINCTGGNDYLRVENNFDITDSLKSGENREGVLSIQVIKSTTEEVTAEIACEIKGNALERTSLGNGSSFSGGVYGVKRSRESSDTKWERVESSIGLTANATKDGSEVTNDFDNIYPWSDIITYNYDDVTKTETAKYGDKNFKFDGSNGQVLTRIPEFYYQRTVMGGNEYIYISKDEQKGFEKSEAFSIGRYTVSGNSTKVYSRSGYTPLVNTTITNFRTYARKLGDDFGQLDYRYFILQLLYLVEYADYNCQEVLGLGNTNNTSSISSGGCNSLGMKSGSIINDGKHSMIYRGIEDIFGNVWQVVDGINIKDHVAYINYNPATYAVDTFAGDYKALSYINSLLDGYSTHLGYDTNHSLISFPTSVGANENLYISDYYYQATGNRIVLVGGRYGYGANAGLWFWNVEGASSNANAYISSRLLRHQ